MKTLNNGSNLDEIIFENRNKAYGAYSLRKNYKRNVVIALFVTLGFLSMSVGTPFILTYMSPEVIVTPDDNITHKFEGMKPPVDEPMKHIELPKPPPSIHTVAGQIKFAPEPVDNPNENPPDITDPDIIHGDTAAINPDDNDGNIPKDIPDEILDPVDIDNKPKELFEVDEEPQFIGDDAALKKFIMDNAKFTEEAKDLGLQGKVYVEFVVTETGEITDVKILKSVDPLLDMIALNAVSKMPKWIPGKKSGYPVSVKMNIPIMFKLYP